ncbi:hypothetical protein BLNAU_16679 [Blattamonas nauphoetae]|uniref:Right handed beta helix domain-containing protein n=1 Tax=Blattamonas nauphoetae TaxID=2049346 RepID=A0ABQ9X9P4_9EUKA|nr:hypothetical protein BLNAU_16679 [Blattamonas nauphoetae]
MFTRLQILNNADFNRTESSKQSVPLEFDCLLSISSRMHDFEMSISDNGESVEFRKKEGQKSVIVGSSFSKSENGLYGLLMRDTNDHHQLTSLNCTFVDNIRTFTPVYVNAAPIENEAFTDRQISTDNDITFKKCTFTSCSAPTGQNGGAILHIDKGSLAIESCTFTSCRASLGPAVLGSFQAPTQFQGCFESLALILTDVGQQLVTALSSSRRQNLHIVGSFLLKQQFHHMQSLSRVGFCIQDLGGGTVHNCRFVNLTVTKEMQAGCKVEGANGDVSATNDIRPELPTWYAEIPNDNPVISDCWFEATEKSLADLYVEVFPEMKQTSVTEIWSTSNPFSISWEGTAINTIRQTPKIVIDEQAGVDEEFCWMRMDVGQFEVGQRKLVMKSQPETKATISDEGSSAVLFSISTGSLDLSSVDFSPHIESSLFVLSGAGELKVTDNVIDGSSLGEAELSKPLFELKGGTTTLTSLTPIDDIDSRADRSHFWLRLLSRDLEIDLLFPDASTVSISESEFTECHTLDEDYVEHDDPANPGAEPNVVNHRGGSLAFVGQTVNAGTVDILSTNFSDCSCANSSGASINVRSLARLFITSCRFHNQFASGFRAQGGAISGWIISDVSVVKSCFTTCQLSDHTQYGHGGAITFQGSDCVIDFCQFEDCSAPFAAHAIHISNSTISSEVTNCVFDRCVGAGIRVIHTYVIARMSFQNCSFINCLGADAETAVIGIYGEGAETVAFSKCYVLPDFSTNKKGVVRLTGIFETNPEQATLIIVGFLCFSSSAPIDDSERWDWLARPLDSCDLPALLFSNKEAFITVASEGTLCSNHSAVTKMMLLLILYSGDLSLRGCTFTSLLDSAHSEDSSHVVDVTIGEGKSLRIVKSTSNSKTSFVSCSSKEDGGGLKVCVSGTGVIELSEVHFSKCSSSGNGGAVLIEVASLFAGTISFASVEFGTGDDKNTATLGADLFVTAPDLPTLVKTAGFMTLRPNLPLAGTFGKEEKNGLMGKDGNKAVESLLFIWYPHRSGDKHVEGATGEDHVNYDSLSIEGSTTIATCSSPTAESDFLFLSRPTFNESFLSSALSLAWNKDDTTTRSFVGKEGSHSPNVPLYLFLAELGSEGHLSNASSDMSVCGFAVYPCASLSKMITRLSSAVSPTIQLDSDLTQSTSQSFSSALTIEGNDRKLIIADPSTELVSSGFFAVSSSVTLNAVVIEISSLKHVDLFSISTGQLKMEGCMILLKGGTIGGSVVKVEDGGRIAHCIWMELRNSSTNTFSYSMTNIEIERTTKETKTEWNEEVEESKKATDVFVMGSRLDVLIDTSDWEGSFTKETNAESLWGDDGVSGVHCSLLVYLIEISEVVEVDSNGETFTKCGHFLLFCSSMELGVNRLIGAHLEKIRVMESISMDIVVSLEGDITICGSTKESTLLFTPTGRFVNELHNGIASSLSIDSLIISFPSTAPSNLFVSSCGTLSFTSCSITSSIPLTQSVISMEGGILRVTGMSATDLEMTDCALIDSKGSVELSSSTFERIEGNMKKGSVLWGELRESVEVSVRDCSFDECSGDGETRWIELKGRNTPTLVGSNWEGSFNKTSV